MPDWPDYTMQGIPTVFSRFDYHDSGVVPAGETRDIMAKIQGAGTLTCFTCLFIRYLGTSVRESDMVLGIVIDDVVIENTIYELGHPSDFVVNAVQPVSFSKFDTTNARFAFGFNFDLKFKENLRIYAKNTHETESIRAFALIGVEFIS